MPLSFLAAIYHMVYHISATSLPPAFSLQFVHQLVPLSRDLSTSDSGISSGGQGWV